MEVRIENPEQGKKELFISVATDKLTPKFEEAYQEYKKKIVLGGFRKGKVPVGLVKQMFGKSIREEVIDGVIPEYSQQAIDDNKLKIIPPAQIDEVDFDLKKGLTFKVVVELQPEIELKKITGFEFERENYEVDDAAVNKTLDQIREQNATMKPIEGEAKDQDYVQADLQQIDETGVPIVGNKYADQYFQIDSKDEFGYKLTSQLVGAKAGDTRRLEIEMPKGEDDSEEKKIDFYEATITDVKTKILPELDDEFAKDAGEYETLQELKDSIVKNLKTRLKHENHQRFQATVTDKLVTENSFEVPEKLVDLQVEMFMRNLMKNQPNAAGIDEQGMRERYRPEAVWGLKWQMIRDKIAETEKIEVSEEDFEAYYKEQAEQQNVEVERVRNRYLVETARQEIEPVVLERKVIDFILQNSKVTEKTVPYSEALEGKNKAAE